jgi:hypothetical protein
MFMNIKPPLAAALLMLASTAMAQLTLTPPPALGTGNFGDATRPLSLTGAYSTNVPDDASFNCSTWTNMNFMSNPLVFCTPAQEMARLSFFGFCPYGNTACSNYMSRIMLPKYSNPAEAQGEIDARAATAAPEAPKPIEAASATEASPQPGDPNFMGPVMGPPVPPGFYEAQDKKAFEKAREKIGADGVKDVVDLGNGNIAMMREDGTAEVCGRSSQCADPVPASTLKNPKIEEWVANNNAGYNQNGGMKSMTNPGPGSKGAPGATGDSQSGSDSQTSPSDEARGLGRQIPVDSMAAGGGSGMSGARAGATAGTSGYGSATSAKDVVKVSQAEVAAQVAQGSTFTGSINAEKNLKVISGEIPGLLNDGARKQAIEDVTTTIADPSKHRAGIQAEANSAP